MAVDGSGTGPRQGAGSEVAARHPYVIRIREAGTTDWGFSFETPIPTCTFVDLEPDIEYELQVRAKTPAGEGEPAYIKMRTNPAGAAINIVPFPKR